MRTLRHNEEGLEPEDGPRHRIVAETEHATLSPWRIVVPLLVGAVFVLFGGVVYYAYVDRAGVGDEPPVVRAEPGPIKVTPKDPGGLDVVNENTQGGRALRQEHAGSCREAAAERSRRPGHARRRAARHAAAGHVRGAAFPTTSAARPAPTLPGPTPAPTAPASPVSGLPRVALPSDSSSVEPAASAAPVPAPTESPATVAAADTAPPPAAGPEAAVDTRSAVDAPVPVPRPEPPVPAASATPPSTSSASAPPRAERSSVATAGGPRPLTADTRPRPATVKEASIASPGRAASIGSGGWRVQLVAVSSRAAAEAAWQVLRRKNPSILGQLPMVIDESSGSIFRLQAGGLADHAAANRACAELKAAGTDCFVVAAR